VNDAQIIGSSLPDPDGQFDIFSDEARHRMTSPAP
jgi:hypothetical protein